MRIYFAHPMSTYHTKHEAKALKAIKRWALSNGGTIVNPGDKKFEKAIKLLYPLAGFDLFDCIAANSDVTVAMPFRDGKHGAGVFSEICAAHRAGKQLYEVDPKTYEFNALNFYKAQGLSVEETRARIKRKQL